MRSGNPVVLEAPNITTFTTVPHTLLNGPSYGLFDFPHILFSGDDSQPSWIMRAPTLLEVRKNRKDESWQCYGWYLFVRARVCVCVCVRPW